MRHFIKRAASLVLAAVLLLGAAPGLLIPEAEAAGAFGDVSDLAMAQNIEVLQLMGVVDGMSSSSFEPSATLTRAQFCKMAVEAMGQGDRVSIYRNYTIFPDVKPGHWAAGYINLASRLTADGSEGGSNEDGGRPTRLISGYSDGTFGPDRTVTYGQAVTILMRMLGYGDGDVSVVWPDGYIDQAMAIGLSDGVKLSGSAPINRGQAVRLFVNLLNCECKGSRNKFYSKIGPSVETNVVLLNANAKDDAGNNVVIVSSRPNEPYILAGNPGSGLLAGKKGALVFNAAGEVMAFVPDNEGSSHSITIASAEATSITDTHGVKYTVDGDAMVYLDNEPSSYGSSFSFLRPGTMVQLYVNTRGRVTTVYVGTTTSDDAVIVAAKGSTDGFDLLTDRRDYKIYKHGEEIRSKDLQKYDVATYSSSNNVIYVSDSRMTVYYSDAYPNPVAPTRIQAAGIQGGGKDGYLDVLPCAVESLSTRRIGDTITLLLTENNKVAGVSTDPAASGNAFGFVDGSGKLTLFNGLEPGAVSGDLAGLAGQVVTVSSYRKEGLSVQRFTGSSVGGQLYVEARRLGNADLSADVRVYEKVGKSALSTIKLTDLAGTIPADKVAYSHKNSMGKVDILVLEDASGTGYIYGRIWTERQETGKDIYDRPITNTYITIDNGRKHGPYLSTAFQADSMVWGGIAVSSDGKQVAAYMRLTEVRNVRISAFRSNTLLYHNGRAYQVSEDVVCYNRITGLWLPLSNILSSSDSCSIFVDSNNVVRGVEVGQ